MTATATSERHRTDPDRPAVEAGTRPRRRFAVPVPWRYLAPAGLLMGMWVYLPAGGVVGLSFLRWNLTSSERPFVGVDNYRRLAEEPELGQALVNTALYAIGLAPLVVVLPLGCAVLLWKHTGRLGGLYRTALFLPVMVSPVVGAVIWQWIFHPMLGVANAALDVVGLGPVHWLDQPGLALWSIVAATGWKVFGLSFILFSAGLASIDRSYAEAAAVDGATEWEITRRVLLPLLAPTTTFVAVLCVILSGQWSFAAINVLTKGGPQGSTQNVFSLLYTYAFEYFDTGLASATGVLFVVAFAVAAGVQVRLARRWAVPDAA